MLTLPKSGLLCLLLKYKSNVTFNFNNGAVIRSWLIELAHDAFAKDSNLEQLRGVVGPTPDAKWAVQEAMDKSLSVPVIANSLFIRNDSQMEDNFSTKVVAALGDGFGGHGVVKK